MSIDKILKPVPGAERYRLKAAEVMRSLKNGSAVFVVIAVLQLVMAHLDMIPLGVGSETQQQISAALGGLVAVLQLGVQYFQHDPRPPAGPKIGI